MLSIAVDRCEHRSESELRLERGRHSALLGLLLERTVAHSLGRRHESVALLFPVED
jgi:hypothetical protein